jgi:hypothetical protein
MLSGIKRRNLRVARSTPPRNGTDPEQFEYCEEQPDPRRAADGQPSLPDGRHLLQDAMQRIVAAAAEATRVSSRRHLGELTYTRSPPPAQAVRFERTVLKFSCFEHCLRRDTALGW